MPARPTKLVDGTILLYHSNTLYLAHDVGKDSPRGADESPDHRQQRLVQHEPLRAQCPPRVRVQHRDHLSYHKRHIHSRIPEADRRRSINTLHDNRKYRNTTLVSYAERNVRTNKKTQKKTRITVGAVYANIPHPLGDRPNKQKHFKQTIRNKNELRVPRTRELRIIKNNSCHIY